MADEPKIEEQDTLSPIEELQKRIEDVEMSLGVFNPRNTAGLRSKDLQQSLLLAIAKSGNLNMYYPIRFINDANGNVQLTIQGSGDDSIINIGNNLQINSGSTKGIKLLKTGEWQPVTSGYPNLGTSTKRFGGADFNNTVTFWYNIRPNTDSSYSSIGASDRYFQYLYSYYVRYKDLAAFKEHDDIALIKNIKEKDITRYQVKGFDKDKKPIKKNETIKVWDETTMPSEVYKDGFYDAGAVNGFLIGTVKQLVEKVEVLENKVEILENKLKDK